ncbi:MAG: hypothetical protein GVX78_03045, partial [Bacteroidetes bacterium]|nr:hypothetical protein [Bacteroidota bacterium]
PETSLKIYDRWGRLVFEESNYDQYQKARDDASSGEDNGGWNPADENNPDGTYYYELLIPSVQATESGYIEVLNADE